MEIKKQFSSFRHALRGIASVYRSERNFKIHVAISVLVLFFSFFFHIRVFEFLVILLVLCLVLVLEMTNTAIEKTTDLMKPRLSVQVGMVKDIMAGVVLLASVFSVIIGLFIFIPYILK